MQASVGVANKLSQLPLHYAIPLAFLAAPAAMLAATFPLKNIEPFWVMEALTGVAGAAAWMAAGLIVAQRNAAAAPIIFLLGAGLAWYLARGIVHSVSPYFGLFSFTVACLAGALVWWLLVRRSDRRYAQLAAIAVPLLTVALVLAVTLAEPALGVTRRLWDGNSNLARVHVVFAERGEPQVIYLWTDDAHALVPGPDSTILLETDPGSGPGRYRLMQVSNETEIQNVCNRMRAAARRRIEAEVVEGTIPPFITRLPLRSVRCERGIIWRAA